MAADGAPWEELAVDELVARGRAGLMRRRMGPHERDAVVEGAKGRGIGIGFVICRTIVIG